MNCLTCFRRLTRLQFRFANGSSMTKEFPYESKLADIIADIRLVCIVSMYIKISIVILNITSIKFIKSILMEC